MATVQENTVHQVNRLLEVDFVKEAIAGKRLRLHAWVYRFETGDLFAFQQK